MHLRLTTALCLLLLELAAAVAAAQPRTTAEIEAFMRRAKVVRTREMSVGITRPLRLTLADNGITHDAVFQSVDEKKLTFQPARGPSEINFVDSWRYNVAAYRLASMLGLDWMMPVTIEYRYQGRSGALSWWRESLMDERRRLKERVSPPDVQGWNHDMYRMRVFASLVHDTDRNLTNVLVSPEWRVIMLDFTRAFRLHPVIQAKEINHCDRQLLARLDELSLETLTRETSGFLSNLEVTAVMKRRDLLLAHVRQLVAERGEDKVLY